MAKNVGLSHPYETIYLLMCNLAHNGPKSAGEYIEQTPNALIVNFDPAETWVEKSLVACFDFSEKIMNTVLKYFKIEINQQYSSLREQFNRIVESKNKL